MSDEETKSEEVLPEQVLDVKSVEETVALAVRGDTYPIELRLEARGMFLEGVPFRRIAENLEIHRSTIFKWSLKGHWQELRDELLREEELRQITRARREIAKELSKTQQRMTFLDRLLLTSLTYKPETEKDENGFDVQTGRMLPRSPADMSLSLSKAVDGMFRLTSARMEYMGLLGKLLGNIPSKVDPSQLDLNQMPDVIVPQPDGGEPIVVDPTNTEPNGGEDDGNNKPN
jgi:hypothetical protein